jgi:hypothetical protein
MDACAKKAMKEFLMAVLAVDTCSYLSSSLKALQKKKKKKEEMVT